MSTSFRSDSAAQDRFGSSGPVVEVLEVPRFPMPRHPAESDVFARHQGIPGHVQEALSDASIVIVGAGGLGGWIAVALARSGARRLTIIDHDAFDLTNASRQVMYATDVGQSKAPAVAHNVMAHMVAGGTAIGMTMPFDQAASEYALSADLVVVGVDDNRCRWSAVRYARRLQVPAVFCMLSPDGMRVHTFLQGAQASDPCLWCALPNLDPDAVAPCASGVITSCPVAAAHMGFFVHRALMGWPDDMSPFNWRATDVSGQVPEETGLVQARPDCPLCRHLGGDDV